MFNAGFFGEKKKTQLLLFLSYPRDKIFFRKIALNSEIGQFFPPPTPNRRYVASCAVTVTACCLRTEFCGDRLGLSQLNCVPHGIRLCSRGRKLERHVRFQLAAVLTAPTTAGGPAGAPIMRNGGCSHCAQVGRLMETQGPPLKHVYRL